MLRTRTGSLYTGIAVDVARRLAAHRGEAPGGAKCLRARGPLALVYRVAAGPRALALRIEHRLKRLAKPRKEQIAAQQPDLPDLLGLLNLGAPPGAPAGGGREPKREDWRGGPDAL
jgi:putative endonuclease